MKVTVNVECTPEEARSFLGLPDVQPIQEAMMNEIQSRMMSGLNALAPESLLKTWMPAGAQSADALQKLFWNQVQSTLGQMTNATTSAMVSFTDPKKRG